MTVFLEVTDAIREELEMENWQIIKGTDLIKELGGDSLNLVNITIALEDKYGMKFPKDLSKFLTVEDVVKFVESTIVGT